MASFGQIKGGEDFKKIQQRLKETGDKTVRRELSRGLNRSVKPLKEAVKKDLPEYLPKRYAKALEPTLKIGVRRRMGRDPSVRLAGTAKTEKGKRRQLGKLDDGEFRKPLFGDRRHFYRQRTKKPGFWSASLKGAGPQVRKEIQKTVRDISRQLTKGN